MRGAWRRRRSPDTGANSGLLRQQVLKHLCRNRAVNDAWDGLKQVGVLQALAALPKIDGDTQFSALIVVLDAYVCVLTWLAASKRSAID